MIPIEEPPVSIVLPYAKHIASSKEKFFIEKKFRV